MTKIEPINALSGFLLCSLLLVPSAQAVDRITFSGTLIEKQPCTLLPADKNIEVELGTVADKYLYLNTRTPGKSFYLYLTGCDISLAQEVKVTFKGDESIPGFLMPDAGSQASGIVIGIETESGTALPLNRQSNAQEIVNGNNVITLRAYIQGEPAAITSRTISLGMFTATATFELAYE